MGRVFRDLDRLNRQDNVKALEALRKQGIEFIKVPDESLVQWTKDASAVPRRLIETGRLSREIVDTLEKLLKEYRAKHSGANE